MFRLTCSVLLSTALSSVSLALENLNEESLGVVSAEGLGHLIPVSTTGISPDSRSSGSASQHFSVPLVELTDHTLPRAEPGQQNVQSSQVLRSNDATVLKVADISIRLDSTQDFSASSGGDDSLRMNLSTRVDSVAAINARHSPTDMGSRGSYFVEQMQVNSTVVINSGR